MVVECMIEVRCLFVLMAVHMLFRQPGIILVNQYALP